MKQFELTITRRDTVKSFAALSSDKIESDNLVELLAQFILVIARIQQQLAAENPRYDGDDIPF